jgi:hypothetical protein
MLEIAHNMEQSTIELAVLITGVLAIVVLYVARLRWYERSRSTSPETAVPDRVTSPPDELPPAFVGKLVGGRTSGELVLATLLDLGQRGYAHFGQIRRKKGGGRKNVEAWRLAPPEDAKAPGMTLRTHEELVLDALFGTSEHVSLRNRISKLANLASSFGRIAVRSLIDMGYLDAGTLSSCRRGMTVGFVALLIGIVGLLPVGLLARYHALGLMLECLALIVVASSWLRKAMDIQGVTETGSRSRAQWLAYGDHLRDLTAETAQDASLGQMLPYAAALGTIVRLNRVYSGTRAALPAWFVPSPYAVETLGEPAEGAGTIDVYGEDYGACLVIIAAMVTGRSALGETAGAAA